MLVYQIKGYTNNAFYGKWNLILWIYMNISIKMHTSQILEPIKISREAVTQHLSLQTKTESGGICEKL